MLVYVESLYYNTGGWLKLGVFKEELEEFLKQKVKIDSQHGDYIISDYEFENLKYQVQEFDDIYQLNELVRVFDDMDEQDKNLMNAMLEAGICDDLEEAIHITESGLYTLIEDAKSEYDIGLHFFQEFYSEFSEMLQSYFNFAEYGKDILINDGYLTSFGFLLTI